MEIKQKWLSIILCLTLLFSICSMVGVGYLVYKNQQRPDMSQNFGQNMPSNFNGQGQRNNN